MVQEGEVIALKRAVDKGWREFWDRRGVNPDSLRVSTCAVNSFMLPNIYEYPNTKSIYRKLATARQTKAVAMVRAKCKG
jgi:hypothetical protein